MSTDRQDREAAPLGAQQPYTTLKTDSADDLAHTPGEPPVTPSESHASVPVTPEQPPVKLPGIESTPVKNKHRGDATQYRDAETERDSVMGHGQLAQVPDFKEDYLQSIQDYNDDDWRDDREAYFSELAGASGEKALYPIMAKALTKICLKVCQPTSDDDSCLAVLTGGDKRCKGKFPGSALRLDLGFVWTTREKAKEIAEKGTSSEVPKWTELISYVEVKTIIEDLPHSAQASSYVHAMPRIMPNLAGMLYTMLAPDTLIFYWADPSGIVRSHRFKTTKRSAKPSKTNDEDEGGNEIHGSEEQEPEDDEVWIDVMPNNKAADETLNAGMKDYDLSEEEFWKMLVRYVQTLVKPLPGLQTRDTTMKLVINEKGDHLWEITVGKEVYSCHVITATSGQSRQTAVFWDPEKHRIIKDHWRDDDRRFKERDILEKIKGLPAVVQVDYSTTVCDLETDEVLVTSDLHSGFDCKYKIPGRRAPRRTKQRSVLKSTGDPFSKCKTVDQILKAIYDGLHAHQICLETEETMHRDVSRYNILINPVHYDTIFKPISDAVFINQVLDPDSKDTKAESTLIDWDAAADLAKKLGQESIATERTGTPMFVARALATGSSFVKVGRDTFRPRFPELKGVVRDKYFRAYSKERYEKYFNSVMNTERCKCPSSKPALIHSPHHDVESFVWVLIHALLLAWPKGDKDEVDETTSIHIRVFQNHDFGDVSDDRDRFLQLDLERWARILHSRLHCLIPMVMDALEYVTAEWDLWPEIVRDHAHEAVKIHVLGGDLELTKRKDPIPLEARERKCLDVPVPQRGVRSTTYGNSLETPSPSKKRSTKRTRDDTEVGSSKSKKSKI